MKRNGFAFLELLVILVILVGLAWMGMNIFSASSDEEEPKIEEVNREVEALSVASYGRAIETSVTTYLTTNPEAGTIVISVDGKKTNDCHVDATSEARANSKTTCSKSGSRVVIYSGETVKCMSATYNVNNGNVVIMGCTVGDSVHVYDWNSATGIINTEY